MYKYIARRYMKGQAPQTCPIPQRESRRGSNQTSSNIDLAHTNRAPISSVVSATGHVPSKVQMLELSASDITCITCICCMCMCMCVCIYIYIIELPKPRPRSTNSLTRNSQWLPLVHRHHPPRQKQTAKPPLMTSNSTVGITVTSSSSPSKPASLSLFS